MQKIAVTFGTLLTMLMLSACDPETGFPTTDLEVIVIGIVIVAAIAAFAFIVHSFLN